jgi:tetratricopeptide (TPR) repeat protein
MFVVARKRLAWQAAFFFFLVYPAHSDDLAEQSHRARELMSEHRFSEAIPIYEQLVKALPDNVGLLLNLALAEEMAGHPAQAAPKFETVLKTQPDSIPALVSLSMARLQLNQPKEAIPLLKRLTKLNPSDRNAIGMLADAELSVGQVGAAAEHFREVSAQDPNDPRAWYGLGKSYEALASQTFNRLSKVAPESPYVATLLADTRVQRHQYRSAFFFYNEAQNKLPDLPGIHAGLAQVYRNTAHLDWAAVEQKREQTLPAPDCAAHRPECDFLAGRFLEAANSAASNASPSDLFWATKAFNQLAIQAFESLSALPESVQMHALKAQIFHDHKQDMEAANEWKAALKLAPDDDKLKGQLAAALFDAKDYSGAMSIVEEELARDPKSPELNYLLGASLFRTEQPEKALPHLELGVADRSDALPAEAALGLTLMALSRNAEAIPHLKKALPLDDDGSLHYSLARAYRAAGQTDLAAQTMRQYQQIQKQNQEINGKLETEAEITAPVR